MGGGHLGETFAFPVLHVHLHDTSFMTGGAGGVFKQKAFRHASKLRKRLPKRILQGTREGHAAFYWECFYKLSYEKFPYLTPHQAPPLPKLAKERETHRWPGCQMITWRMTANLA